MKCDLCNGTGKLLKNWYDTTGLMTHFKGDVCFMCDGKGTIGELQTNEEWLRQCTTEQLAEWLRGVYWHCHEIDCKHCNYPWRCMEKGDIVEWLKQPRREW